MVRPTKCAARRVSPPQKQKKTNLYRHLKCRLGRSLRSRFYRTLVSFRKASTHQLTRNEGGFSGSTITLKDLPKQPSPDRLRQHLSGGIHQQTGQCSIGTTLCPNVESPTWCNQNSVTLRSRHITGSLNGQPLQEEPDPINRVVLFKLIFKLWDSSQVDLFATSLKKLPLCISPIQDPQAWAVDALNIP